MRGGALPKNLARPVDVAPILRGLIAHPARRKKACSRFVLDHRAGQDVLAFVNGRALARYAAQAR